MSKISTWEELLASDLPLRGEDVTYDSLHNHYAIIRKPDDNLLRLEWGLVIMSVIHPVFDRLASREEELMVVVREAELELAYGDTYYVPWSGASPHYRTAGPLGLTGNHADPNVYSVLVSTDKLGEIMFSDTPEPLKQWEVDILSDT